MTDIRPKFPFGLSGYWGGFDLRAQLGNSILRYTPNPKQFILHNCCADEVFYGGATFGGKSFGEMMHTAMHCLSWGRDAHTVIFRRTYDQLEKTIIEEFRRHLDGKFGKYKAGDIRTFFWENGAKTRFRHMETRADMHKNQGTNYSLIVYDELTHFEEEMYTTMFAWLRSPYNKKIHCQMVSTSNPGSIGHKWVYERFIRSRQPEALYEFETPAFRLGGEVTPPMAMTRIYIKALATDNKAGLDNDPNYLSRLRTGMSEQKFHALVEGDWDYFEGMVFPEWDAERHVVAGFAIPKTWKVIRCIDWGYKSPYYVGWLAQEPETGDIYLIDEIYGHRRGPRGGVLGPEKSPEEVRLEIDAHEYANISAGRWPRVRIGPGSNDMWSNTGLGVQIGDLINENGVLFKKPVRDHGVRIQTFHALLRDNPTTGNPRFRIFGHCKGFINTFPQLTADQKNLEDVDRYAEDHPYEAVGYGLIELQQAPAPRATEFEEMRKLSRRYKQPAWV